MLKKFAIGLIIVLVVLIAVIATRPDQYSVSRSTVIHAPPAAVFVQVNDLKAWTRWSPWEQRDPAMQRMFGEPSSGVGATYHWVGNSEVGEGTMTIAESKPAEYVGLTLDFVKPMAGQSRATFDLAPTDGGTTVTWTMSGKNNFVAKAFCLVMNMDKMVGGDFEQGLAKLKSLCETASPPAPVPAPALAPVH